MHLTDFLESFVSEIGESSIGPWFLLVTIGWQEKFLEYWIRVFTPLLTGKISIYFLWLDGFALYFKTVELIFYIYIFHATKVYLSNKENIKQKSKQFRCNSSENWIMRYVCLISLRRQNKIFFFYKEIINLCIYNTYYTR